MISTKVLCILDGFGLAPKSPNNPSYLAKMPNFRSLLKDSWWSTLNADGDQVGQETGLVGNSEVGHMNIGGLKLVAQLSYQVTTAATKAYDLDQNINPEQLFDPKKLLKKSWENQSRNKTVHLVGLFSTGTIHSDLRHWVGSIEAAGQAGAEKIVLHLISDGRDSDRQSLVATWDYFVNNFEDRLRPYENQIFLGSVGGRFFSMDRDKNWDRVAKGVLPMFDLNSLGDIKNLNYQDQFHISDKFINFFHNRYNLQYDKIFEGLEFYRDNQLEKSVDLGHNSENWQLTAETWHPVAKSEIPPNFTQLDQNKNCIQYYADTCYKDGVFDETIIPKSVDSNSISQNDSVWMLNFRTDRMKQLSKMICQINTEFDLNLLILGMNDYGIDREQILDPELAGFAGQYDVYYPVFKNKPVENTLAERISSLGKTQLHISETEKYNHVTYFLNGGQNKKSAGEDWVVIDSNKVTSHAEKPEMKAVEITDYILENGLGKYDYIIVNYANPDMVGHTGDIQACVQAMEVLDVQIGRLIDKCNTEGHKMLFTADHGNVEMVGSYEVNGKMLTDTEHNPNQVPCIIYDANFNKIQLLENIKNYSQKFSIHGDLVVLESLLDDDNSVNIENSETWLEGKQIPTPQLGLWYAGLIFLSL
jgi:2,3-bisphosphoglycerate-independent phosphoglycerate mutase